jgi:hypothetical protein
MAIQFDPMMDDEKKKQLGAGQAMVSPTGGASGASPTPVNKPSSGQFTNLQSYIRANENNAGVDQAVNNLAGAANTATDNTAKAYNDLSGIKAGDAAQDTMTDADRNSLETIGNDFRNIGGKDYVQSIYDQTAAKYQDAGAYSGPDKDSVDTAYSNFANNMNTQQSALASATDKNARGAALQKMYNGDGQYTAGQGRLDNFLVGRTGAGAFNQAADNAKTKLAGMSTDSAAQIAETKKGEIGAAQQSYTDLAQKWRGILGGAQDRVQGMGRDNSMSFGGGTKQPMTGIPGISNELGSAGQVNMAQGGKDNKKDKQIYQN